MAGRGAARAAFAETSGAKAAVAYKFVSPEYFSVLDIAVVRGGRSRRPSARRISRWPSFPKRPRARCGRMPMRSARSCASTRIRRTRPTTVAERCARRAGARVANVHGGRGRPGRRRVPDRTLQAGRRLRADECRDAQDVAHRARPRRSRTGTADAPQSIDQRSIPTWPAR